jgi:hypothetical protein
VVAERLSVRKEPDAHPHPLAMKTMNESVTLSFRTDG